MQSKYYVTYWSKTKLSDDDIKEIKKDLIKQVIDYMKEDNCDLGLYSYPDFLELDNGEIQFIDYNEEDGTHGYGMRLGSIRRPQISFHGVIYG